MYHSIRHSRVQASGVVVDNRLPFYEYLVNRQKIWYDREINKKPYPWTDIPELHKYRYCNCFRELDCGTKYIQDRIIRKPLDLRDKLLNVVLYRFFNVTNLFEDIFDGPLEYNKFDFDTIVEKLDDAIAQSKIIFNTSYQICQMPIIEYRSSSKHVQVVAAISEMHNNIDRYVSKLSYLLDPYDAHETITEISNVGNFLGAQILIDLTYIDRFLHFDDNDFCIIGPGSEAAIKRISGGKECKDFRKYRDYIVHPNKYRTFLLHLRDDQEKYFDMIYNKTGIKWDDITWSGGTNGKYLSLCNIQHSICEWRKFDNYVSGVANKTRYYKPKVTAETF